MEKDIFYLDRVFPEAQKIFTETFKSAENIIQDGLVVLDTNVLLVLFDATEKNISDIKSIYVKYKKENRFFIPARVAREFANNRATRIGDIFLQIRQIKDKLNTGAFKINPYPILEHSDDYKGLSDSFEIIRKQIAQSKTYLENLESQIQGWTWDDSVSVAYKEIFTPEIIIDVKRSKEEIEKDLLFRIEYKIAPGYKDSKKPDDGVGDLVIWQTLLELAKEKNKDLLFVTNDQKNDWFYKQDKVGLYPKYELFDEFRRFTGGKSIAIVNFIKFLELSNAKAETIEEIKTTIQESHPSDSSGFVEGAMVEHGKFGIGKITKIRTAGSSTIAEVSFDDFGQKSLMLKYSGLKVVSSNLRDGKCKHENMKIIPNGVFDDYLCTDCNTVFYRQYSDDSD